MPLLLSGMRARRAFEASLLPLPPIYLENVAIYKELSEVCRARIKDLEDLLCLREVEVESLRAGASNVAILHEVCPLPVLSYGAESSLDPIPGAAALHSVVSSDPDVVRRAGKRGLSAASSN